ncbi:nuclear transport factor 2 family protein [Chitinophaga filiformis]|uniref:YybH family protein n=1 Tax=Chitinophaga filiformis TaxID=104663 RepID=UPI001F2F3CDE|nr:nuclear transport factor 2 family protein [Chitinophaga filiformis]MCF6402541.1 nuclear transport factor 2 family protein [Chitinophaga filiformis]MCF6403541.1 nuclear transport factor 2 family protein [Chitinophaga filiformis]
MGIQEEKQAIQQLLTAYADTLNTANIPLIHLFYTSDGLFMAADTKTFTTLDLSTRNNGSYLKRTKFHIDFTVHDIALDTRYAFVQATAVATTHDPVNGQQSIQSRDFFVLRKEAKAWKIYRYMFNYDEDHPK